VRVTAKFEEDSVRVIGVDISAGGLIWVILGGTATSCVAEAITPAKLALPSAEPTQVDNLLALKANVVTALAPRTIDYVAIIKAGKDCSVERTKIECMVQLAARETAIPCVLVPPQTLAAAEKRHLAADADAATQSAVAEIEPKYLKKAALVAWCVLNGRR
jgi:hypothetical protein